SDEGEEVVVVGALDHVHEGESVAVEGGWQRHPKHGWRFVAERTRVQEPASEQALLAYLGSVKHVGPRGAQWLLDRHGPEAVLAPSPRPWGGRPHPPGVSTPACGTPCTRPRATGTATSPAPSWPSARGACWAPTPTTASTSSPPADGW